MCGIFGYSWKKGKIDPEKRAVLAAMLGRFNDERGGDSWGIVGITGDKYKVERGLGDLADNIHQLLGYDTLFAHTRYATHGEKTIKNAHPFKIGKLLGAHNGMIRNHEILCEKYNRKFPVDSLHIFAHLNAGKDLSELEGYGAIEWIERSNPSTIFLTRFSGGMLSVVGIGNENNTDGVIWSSDGNHLIRALASAGITDYFKYEVKIGEVYGVFNGRFYFEGKKMNLAAPKPLTKQQKEAEVRRRIIPMGKFNPLNGRKIDDLRLWTRVYAQELR